MNLIIFFLYSMISVFLIISPFSAVMTFVAFTNRVDSREKNLIAIYAVFLACLIALFFAVMGELVLDRLNISIDVLRVVCGGLLLSVVYDVVNFKDTIGKMEGHLDRRSFRTGPLWMFPLGVPLLTGPGVIATVLTLTTQVDTFEQKTLVVMAVVGAFAITLVVFRFSNIIDKWMTYRRIYVFTRILAVLLLALAANMIFTGLDGLYRISDLAVYKGI